MPRKYQNYNPNANLARMAGGLGYGAAAAGSMATEHGNKLMDNDYRNAQAKTRKDQFGITQKNTMKRHDDTMGLGYTRINAQDRRSLESNKLGWANHDQRTKMLARPSYIVKDTNSGIMAFDQNDMTKPPVNIGTARKEIPTALDVATLTEKNQKIYESARTNAAAHYGEDFDSLPAAQQDFLTKEYMNGTRNHKLLGTGWFDGDVRVNMNPTTPAQDNNATNAQIQILTKILEQQNALLKGK